MSFRDKTLLNSELPSRSSLRIHIHIIFQVSEFCDESSKVIDEALVHNSATTNAQNTNCQGRSVWEVGEGKGYQMLSFKSLWPTSAIW